jgi:hypothetical protein
MVYSRFSTPLKREEPIESTGSALTDAILFVFWAFAFGLLSSHTGHLPVFNPVYIL